MDENIKKTFKIKIDQTIEALKKNNMNAYYAETSEDAASLAKSMLEDGCTVTHGGSVTLSECKIPEILKNGNYKYLDRSVPGLTKDEIENIYRSAFTADVYFSSTNAITLNGELYNVDGNSNRVAALLFGPKKVIVIAGYNKIVNTLDDAVKRVKCLTAPANCVRLNKNTYCSINGKCISANNANANMCDGCTSTDRICRNYVVMGPQSPAAKGRINVIIVGEELGY